MQCAANDPTRFRAYLQYLDKHKCEFDLDISSWSHALINSVAPVVLDYLPLICSERNISAKTYRFNIATISSLWLSYWAGITTGNWRKEWDAAWKHPNIAVCWPERPYMLNEHNPFMLALEERLETADLSSVKLQALLDYGIALLKRHKDRTWLVQLLYNAHFRDDAMLFATRNYSGKHAVLDEILLCGLDTQLTGRLEYGKVGPQLLQAYEDVNECGFFKKEFVLLHLAEITRKFIAVPQDFLLLLEAAQKLALGKTAKAIIKLYLSAMTMAKLEAQSEDSFDNLFLLARISVHLKPIIKKL